MANWELRSAEKTDMKTMYASGKLMCLFYREFAVKDDYAKNGRPGVI